MATVTNQTEFIAAIAANDPEIIIANDISLTSPVTLDYGVHIKGEGGASIFWFPPSVSDRFLFIITAAGKLTMDTLTLDAGGRNGGLVKLEGGAFTMNDGVILQNIVSTTDSNAVRIEPSPSGDAGTFIMNGGLITSLDMGRSTAVFCRDGTIAMNADAAIDGNEGMAVNIIGTSDSMRPILTMTGDSRISNNRSGQAGAIISMRSDIVIGVNEGDAPRITGNSSPGNGGGIYAGYASHVSIGQNAEISGNSCAGHHGAILVQNDGSTLHISGHAKIRNNRSGVHSGAISIIANAQAVIEGDVEISGNIAGDTTIGAGGGYGGGILIGTGAVLELKGNVAIHGNTADNGAGIYLATPPDPQAYDAPVLTIGEDGSSVSIYNNTARNLGGGVFIGETCALTLTGQASVYDNNAVSGQGVYNDGILKAAGAPRILDGLFFDCPLEGGAGASMPPQPKPRIQPHTPVDATAEHDGMMQAVESVGVLKTGEGPFVYSSAGMQVCGKAPIIDEALTAEAVIQVEASGYVTPPNVPLVLAQGGAIPLTEADRAAWRLPSQFDPGYAVMLSPGLDQVVIDAVSFDIVYNDLYGVTNTNPVSYKINTLPIKFAPPGERKGYAFMRWRDAAGNPVTQIPAGFTGDLALTAVWQALVYNIVYYDLYGAANANPASYSIDNLPILLAAPGDRPGYAFVEWRDAAGNSVTQIPTGMTGDLTLTAVWAELFLVFHGNAPYACNVPQAVRVESGVADIPCTRPCRPCYVFERWSEDASGNGRSYCPGDRVGVSGKNTTLYAQWLLGCCMSGM